MKVGRNGPCPCGSGKKYKKCCFPKADPDIQAMTEEPTRGEVKKHPFRDLEVGGSWARRGKPGLWPSREDAIAAMFDQIRKEGFTPLIERQEKRKDEEMGEFEEVEIALICPHGGGSQSRTITRNPAGTWEWNVTSYGFGCPAYCDHLWEIDLFGVSINPGGCWGRSPRPKEKGSPCPTPPHRGLHPGMNMES